MKKWKKLWCILLVVMLCMVTFGNFPRVSHAAKGDLGEGYGADNIDTEFTTVDGDRVSSHSEGIVTILLFARTNGMCLNSNNVIKSLCSSNWIQKEDVRLLIVDIDQSPVETVRAMQNENGKDAAVFCYDETYAASFTMFSYLRDTAGAASSVTLPVTVIIDGNNKVQYCRTGYITTDAIYSYVADLAGWDAMGEDDNGRVDVYVEGTFDEEQAFQVLELVNEARAAQGKNPLKIDAVLTEKAMQRAAECSVYYSHTRPNGESCFSILERPYTMGCAENIAAGYQSADAVVTGWLNSPGHYANIMNENYESIGIGCFYQNGTRYWTQLFSVYSGAEKSKETNSVKKVVVKADSNNLGSLSLRYAKKELQAGETAAPILSLTNLGFGSSVPSKDNITFQTSNEAVIKVDEDGTLHARSQGTAVITAVLDGVLKAEYTVTVRQGGQTLPSASVKPSGKPEESHSPIASEGSGIKPEIPIKGDVNQNTEVDLGDAQLALKAALDLTILSAEQTAAADVDGNGKVDLTDAQMILKAALDLIELSEM